MSGPPIIDVETTKRARRIEGRIGNFLRRSGRVWSWSPAGPGARPVRGAGRVVILVMPIVGPGGPRVNQPPTPGPRDRARRHPEGESPHASFPRRPLAARPLRLDRTGDGPGPGPAEIGPGRGAP